MGAHVPCGDGGASGVDCNEALEELYSYLDGELTSDKRAAIQVHLNKCGYCGDAAHFEAELRALVQDCAKAHAPGPLLDKIRSKLADEAHSA